MINVKAKIHNRYVKTFSLSNVDYSEALLYQKNLSSLKCQITYDAALLGKGIHINVCIFYLFSFSQTSFEIASIQK